MSEPLKSYLGGISAAEESRRPRHPPAKWKPAAMPPAVLAEALGVRHRRPELWDLCRSAKDPVDCYGKLVAVAERGGEGVKLLRHAVMYGVPVEAVVDYLAEGDYRKAAEVIERRRSPETLVL
ncbi:hypothetical protein [Pyrobaculum aerophilum]|uniref:Uncharacterized protein n=1 Tax=Pyrobaculum aerophilum TaxID=13773 RepID=A0A371QWB0_9CREN|nr:MULTISPECIES: hypothetical protein [Pyrobaculum]MCX8136825.1 hypothetical protein [Pyrobaculum aerophilum]RFA94522.1 hypothetical protein CGL52_14290 [Pyrobaculum aerophilum]RFA96762.1 hypothetical protein CGL51_04390 [Pyrobaculum aerophilum]